jgi:hypothetical protein
MERTDEMRHSERRPARKSKGIRPWWRRHIELYERLSQNGAPALTMMESTLIKMSPMNFQVTQEAAALATEAHIHHMCAQWPT